MEKEGDMVKSLGKGQVCAAATAGSSEADRVGGSPVLQENESQLLDTAQSVASCYGNARKTTQH